MLLLLSVSPTAPRAAPVVCLFGPRAATNSRPREAAITTQATQPRIDARKLESRLSNGKGIRLVDVRMASEFAAVHIQGSVNVPLDELGRYEQRLAREVRDPLVILCQSGKRSAQAQEQLVRAGAGDVTVLEGGINAWEGSGGAVERGREKWDMNRQVRLLAGSVAAGSILASRVVPGAKWLAGAVGAGLAYSAVTDSCAISGVLAKLPYNRGEGQDTDAAVAQLAR